MKNIENYSVQPLDTKEKKSIDGGFPILWWVLIVLATGIVFALLTQDLDALVAAFNEGKEAAKNN